MKNKELRKLFLVLIFFSLAGGIYYNFQEVWLAENGMSVNTISIIYSLCALFTVTTIFLCSNIIKTRKIKAFTCIFLFIKSLAIFALFILNNSGYNNVIKALVILDYVLDTEIYACIYPMITFINKSDKIYAARGLTYSFMYYLGMAISALCLGRIIGNFEINNNIYVLAGGILSVVSLIMLLSTDINKYNIHDVDEIKLLIKLLDKIKRDKISIMYLISAFVGQISYSCVLGMQISLLVNLYGTTSKIASIVFLTLGISASVFGFLVLWKLTFKNDYVNISIKLLVRAILFFLALIFNNNLLSVVAIMYTAFTAESHTHVVDAPYINRYEKKFSLAFCNLKDMTQYAGKAIGVLLCGVGITHGIKYIFMFALFFIIIQLVLCYVCLYLRNKEAKEVQG